MLLALVQGHIFAVLPQVDRVPPVRLLEPREPYIRKAQSLGRKKAFLGFGEPISEALYRGGRHMFASMPFEGGIQDVLARKRPILLILCLECCHHLVIERACLGEASHEQFPLCLSRIQTVLKHLHASILIGS